MMKFYQQQPCNECPWRTDVAPGQFLPSRFEALAATAYDMARVQFACHKSPDDNDIGCAGFALRGAAHNFSFRMAMLAGAVNPREITSPYPLHKNYRAMAIANGVMAGHPALRNCRDDTAL